MKKLQTFSNLSLFEKSLFFKAFFLSAYVRFVTLYLPMRFWYKSLMGEQISMVNDKPKITFTPGDKLKLRKTIQMVRLACRYAPWETKCLVESILLKKVFAKYKLPIYLGLNKVDNKYLAHAWVNNKSVTNNNFEVVSVHV